jgi:hypothetical protein
MATKQKYKILAVYRPHIVYRILDIFLSILLIIPILFVLWLFPHIPSEYRFMAIMICLMPSAHVIVLLMHFFSFRLIVTSEGLILQALGRREVPFEAMEGFDWQIPYNNLNQRNFPRLGIALNRPIESQYRGLFKVFLFRVLDSNAHFFIPHYAPIPKHFGILRREINYEKFLKTEFGQILYDHAPQLFPQS